MATSNEQSPVIMERRAINPLGRLGSLYDGCRDRIIDKPTKHLTDKHFRLSERPQCALINGNTDTGDNLLRSIGVEDELRLSLLLNLTKRDGIGAVLDYPHCVDEHTRFLYYSWKARRYQLEKYPEFTEIRALWDICNTATHMITSIDTGIDIIVVLQLPLEAKNANKIDNLLKQLCEILFQDELNNFTLSNTEKEVFGHIVKTKVYSNIPNLNKPDIFSNILEQIVATKKHAIHHPLSYTLQTITSLYPTRNLPAVPFKPLSTDLEKNVEHYIIQFRNMMKCVEPFREGSVVKLLRGCFQSLFQKSCIPLSHVKEKCLEEMQRFSKLVVDARSDQKSISDIFKALRDNKQISLKKSITDFVHTLQECDIKDSSITNLRQKVGGYWNIAQRYVGQSEDTSIIEHRSANDVLRDRIYDPTKHSDENNQLKSANQPQRSTEKKQNDLIISPSNVNTSVSPFQPTNMAISSRDEIDHGGNHSLQEVSPSTNVPKISLTVTPPPPPTVTPSPPPTDDTINILLLGETGVGKSTFINAFANYLVFKSLDQAQENEPIVIIPVSFIMTVGDHFEEHTIKFGEIDSLNNENFNNVGQSVTQHCKSYVFDPHQFNGTKLRIIDTPGFGDTRGLEQDDQNMEHILQYINNQSHLNAICFLLKPNSSRLNMFFRTCLTQLFSFLAPAARGNVIFCFTNARSTFYTPGDTAPLLRTMLASSSIGDIPFKKENTFCFDSESFRYLVALRNRIPFSEDNKQEYEKSWSISVKESDRLLCYIDTKLIPYHMDNGWESIKHAEFEISHMIRPMLEAIRNFLRNLILCDKKLPSQLIELYPKALHHVVIRCRSCKPNPHQVGQFWIISDLPHEIQTDFPTCSCTPDQHVPIDYILEHELSNNVSGYHSEKITIMLGKLRQVCAKFAYFLMHVVCSTKDDPFLTGLATMIEEESDICRSQKQTVFNQRLVEELEEFKNRYEQFINTIKPEQEYLKLTAIYELIKTTGGYSLVCEQLEAAKATQQNMMAEYEYEPQKI